MIYYPVGRIKDQDLFGVHDLDGDEVFVDVTTGENVEQDATIAENVKEQDATIAKNVKGITAATTSQISKDDVTLAQTLMEIKAAKPKANGVTIQEPTEFKTTSPPQPSQHSHVKDKENVKESLNKTQAEVTEGSSNRVGQELEQESANKQKLVEQEQAKVVDDDTAELKRCLEIVPKDDDDVAIEATPLSSKSPTINFNREDLEVLRSIVNERFKKTKPLDDMDNLLFQTLKTMFEPHVEDIIWKYQQGAVKVNSWKLFYSCGVYCVTTKNMVYYLLVEKMYPFTNSILHQLWTDVRLHIDYEVEMAYVLFRLIRRHINDGYKPE
uniref:Uncharacterized protein n=1 Tax=Tanacetum cinerariifolium TaxID=118510 RepID=A0A6L2N3N6_TANCI|nr:hypothetical protein [Tanacetum cinerariifolium]